ncbi:MAG: hypothetical protein R3B95_11560 [Nitrospirales bacterium]|nr:hypothetical protein [Nitrospirales bacterium]
MANPKKAEFDVYLGQTVTAKITFDVVANTERATGQRLVTAVQQGALSMTELQQIVLHAGKQRVGGLTLKGVMTYLQHEENRGLYLKVIEALAGFFEWMVSPHEPEGDGKEDAEGEA